MTTAVAVPVPGPRGIVDDDGGQAAFGHRLGASIVADDVHVHIPRTGTERQALRAAATQLVARNGIALIQSTDGC